MSLYDKPGAYFVDHPNARRAVARRVAALAVFATLVVPPAAGAAVKTPGGVGQYPVVKNPGGVGQYIPIAASGSLLRM